MHTVLVAVVSVLIVLGIMVVVHEFGHFLAAKLFGVRVEQFSVGFPPRLIGFKVGETDYCISAIPLGGYVKMTGESMPGEDMSLDSIAVASEGVDSSAPSAGTPYDRGALTSHPRWQRIIIALAGPCANFVLALGLMTGFFMLHNEVPLFYLQPVTADWIVDGSAAAAAGLQPGDRIVSFDGQSDPNWEKVNERLILDLQSLGGARSIPLVVDRAGQQVPLTLAIPADMKAKEDSDFLPMVGVLPVTQPEPVKVRDVQPGSPAAKAGIQSGDQFLSVDGHTLHGTQSIITYLQSRKGAPLNLVINRAGQTIPVTVLPLFDTAQPPSAWRIGFAGTLPPFHVEQMPLPKAIAASVKTNRSDSLLILEVLKRVVTHRMSLGTLSGPIGIAQQTGQAWEATQTSGWEYMIKVMTTISLNLGILNLLPFPILDGGMIMFLIIESFLRRDVNPVVKERVYKYAFVLILVFAAYIIFNDITKLPIFTQTKL
jgi:regulator of sigma E protease